MQNGIYEEGWSEFSNRFSMNLTKVLFVAFIFLFALSFAAATGETETPAGTAGTETPAGGKELKVAETAEADKPKDVEWELPKANAPAETKRETKRETERGTEVRKVRVKKAATHFQERVSQLLPVVLYGSLLLWACSGLVVVYPKSGAMAWIMRKYPSSDFEIQGEYENLTKGGYLCPIFEWIYVFYKNYSLPFEALFLVSGVLLSATNREVTIKYCVVIAFSYGILAILVVGIDISSYLRWEGRTIKEKGHKRSIPVKVSDHMLRILIFLFELIVVVLKELLDLLNICIEGSSLDRFQWVALLLWNSVAFLLSVLYVLMWNYIILWHHPFVDAVATIIVFAGIYLPLLLVIEDIVRVIILPRILELSLYLVKPSGAIAGETFSGSESGSSGSESKVKTN